MQSDRLNTPLKSHVCIICFPPRHGKHFVKTLIRNMRRHLEMFAFCLMYTTYRKKEIIIAFIHPKVHADVYAE